MNLFPWPQNDGLLIDRPAVPLRFAPEDAIGARTTAPSALPAYRSREDAVWTRHRTLWQLLVTAEPRWR